MERYHINSEYNSTACEDQVVPVEDSKGCWVRYEDAAALLATVEALREAYAAYVESGFNEILEDAFAAIPQQHLAEIRAQAVMDAVKFCNRYLAFPVKRGKLADEVLAVSEIKQYADSIKQESK